VDEVTSESQEMTREAVAEPSVVLLGPQKGQSTKIGTALRELGVRKQVALVTAGWQEREADDAALVAELAALGMKAVNLRLHKRSEEVFSIDEPFADAYSARQERLRHIQGFYRIRLDYTGDAARAISVRHVDAEILEQESRVSVEQFRQLDRDHVERCRAIHIAFEERWRMHERPIVARNIRDLKPILEDSEAVVICGGHVASLLNRLKLFDIGRLASGKHIVASSAGAMVLTERIILFHDFPPFGTAIAQVLDAGLGLAPGIVVLPDPQRRIDPRDRGGISRFAQRMRPSTCVALDGNARVVFTSRRITSASAQRLTWDGDVESAWNGEQR
jgi:hypothetical protein